MITWRGYLYLVCTALVYLALAYTGFNLLAIIFPVLILLPLLSAVQLLLAGKMLTVKQNIEPPMLERTKHAKLIVNLQQGFLSHGEIVLIVEKPGQDGRPLHERRRMPLLANTNREIDFAINCVHRGLFKIGIIQIRSRDLFGLFFLPIRSRRICRQLMCDITVLPKSNVKANFSDVTSNLTDIEHHRDYRIGDEIDAVANLRDHRPGDSMKRTHWKISARIGKTMIKEFENSVQNSGLLLLDMARTMPAEQLKGCLDLADNFTDRAAFLIKSLLESCNGLRIAQNQPHLSCYVEKSNELVAAQLMLAGLEWSENYPAEIMLAEQTSLGKSASFVILMTTRLNESVVSQLLALTCRGIQVELILVQTLEINPEREAALRQAEVSGLPITVLEYVPTGKGVQ